jgi:hypothetical protein
MFLSDINTYNVINKDGYLIAMLRFDAVSVCTGLESVEVMWRVVSYKAGCIV